MSTFEAIQIKDAEGNLVDGTHPLPTSVDSVYICDVDTTNSDNGGFTGSVTDYFDNLHSVNIDDSTDNPKIIKIWFKHSIQLYSIGFGCDTSGKSFSNVKVKIFGSDEVVRETVDDSANDEKLNSKAYDFAPSKANGVIVEFHTADEINLSNIIIWKVNNVNARLSAVSDLTGATEDVGSFRGALNVHLADVHRISLNRSFTQVDASTTTVSTASDAGDTAIEVADTTGFVVTGKIELTSGSVQEPNIVTITAVTPGTPGTLTLDRPLDNPYPIGAGVEEVVTNMAAGVLGSLAAPLSFRVAPPAGEIWHGLRLLLAATFAAAAADNLFGSQGALTNGLVLRQNLSTGLHTISNWKTNGDIKLDQFDLPYTDKAGPSLFGMNGRFTFKRMDFVPHLVGDNGDFLEILRQDNITLTSLEIKVQGHKVGV